MYTSGTTGSQLPSQVHVATSDCSTNLKPHIYSRLCAREHCDISLRQEKVNEIQRDGVCNKFNVLLTFCRKAKGSDHYPQSTTVDCCWPGEHLSVYLLKSSSLLCSDSQIPSVYVNLGTNIVCGNPLCCKVGYGSWGGSEHWQRSVPFLPDLGSHLWKSGGRSHLGHRREDWILAGKLFIPVCLQPSNQHVCILIFSFTQLLSAAEYCFYCSTQGDIRKLPLDIAELRPTIFTGVPRVWERIHDKVMQRLSILGSAGR